MAKFKNSSVYGKLMIMIGILVAVPIVCILFYPEDYIYFWSFMIPASISIGIGSILCYFKNNDQIDNKDRQSLTKKNSYIVLFAWTWGILCGAVPFLLSKQLTVVQAVFESVSGWTTTGLSVMDVSITSHIFLFYRSFMQFCGGLGFVLMMIILITGKQSMDLYSAEGHPDKLMPNLKMTAQIIFLMYSAFLVIGTIAYTIFGMPLFDSICHAMCSLSTGGFSNKLNSIGEYNSFPIELVTIVLMLIGTTNFAVLLLIMKRRWKQVLKVSEIRFLILLLVITTPVIAFSLICSLNMGIIEGFRHALFNVVSALSTTGYSSMSYANWPTFAVAMLILMMLIGGGIGSTAGGLKLTRVYLLFRVIIWNIRRRVLPERSVDVMYYTKAQGKIKIDEDLEMDTIGFVGTYIVLYSIGSLLIVLTEGCGLMEAMFEFASALGTVGLSIGITTTTTGSATLIIEMLGMILGRLEIFIVLIGIYTSVKEISNYITH